MQGPTPDCHRVRSDLGEIGEIAGQDASVVRTEASLAEASDLCAYEDFPGPG